MEKTNETIALLVPTRARPKGLLRFWESALNTALNIDNINLHIYVDNDDAETISLLGKLPHPEKVFPLVGDRVIMSQMVNLLEPRVTDEILFFGADDLVMRTKGWDSILINAFSGIPDRIALFYGNDLTTGQHPEDFASHPIIHKNWSEALGYVSPPYFSCDYADTWLNVLADGLGRKAQLPFTNEHMHFTVGKAPMDATYTENRQRFVDDNMPQVYYDMRVQRDEDLRKLATFIQEFNDA